MATIDFLLVGGGGAGGWGSGFYGISGAGGGAGGYRYFTNQTIETGSYPVIIGSGATASDTYLFDPVLTIAGDTIFSGITAYGGGNGAGYNAPNWGIPQIGGCGGGGTATPSWTDPDGYGAKGMRNQGFADHFNRGGSGGNIRGGGGGAGQFGFSNAGNGGAGIQCPLDNQWYAGGGGGAIGGLGGLGGGGKASSGPGTSGISGTANTGGGGGAGALDYNAPDGPGYEGPGGNGGSGIVKIKYLTTDFDSCTGGNKIVDGSYTIHIFTGSSTFIVGNSITPTPTPSQTPTSTPGTSPTPTPSVTPSITPSPSPCVYIPVKITLTETGLDSGPFNLYSNVDNFTVPFEIDVQKDWLTNTYVSNVVPCGTSTIKVYSNGVCINYFDITPAFNT